MTKRTRIELTPALIQQTVEMLDLGFSTMDVANRLPISFSSVSRINQARKGTLKYGISPAIDAYFHRSKQHNLPNSPHTQAMNTHGLLSAAAQLENAVHNGLSVIEDVETSLVAAIERIENLKRTLNHAKSSL
jgi:hypothetical protein